LNIDSRPIEETKEAIPRTRNAAGDPGPLGAGVEKQREKYKQELSRQSTGEEGKNKAANEAPTDGPKMDGPGPQRRIHFAVSCQPQNQARVIVRRGQDATAARSPAQHSLPGHEGGSSQALGLPLSGAESFQTLNRSPL